MKISVEMKGSDGTKYSYVLFDDVNAVYLETTSGLSMRQDGDLPGYRITEADDDPDRKEH